MRENLYSKGQRVLSQEGRNNWDRIFSGSGGLWDAPGSWFRYKYDKSCIFKAHKGQIERFIDAGRPKKDRKE